MILNEFTLLLQRIVKSARSAKGVFLTCTNRHYYDFVKSFQFLLHKLNSHFQIKFGYLSLQTLNRFFYNSVSGVLTLIMTTLYVSVNRKVSFNYATYTLKMKE